MTKLTSREQLLNLLRNDKCSVLSVPREWIQDLILESYTPAEGQAAYVRAMCDAHKMAARALDQAAQAPPLLRLGPGGDYTRDWPVQELPGERDDEETKGGWHDE